MILKVFRLWHPQGASIRLSVYHNLAIAVLWAVLADSNAAGEPQTVDASGVRRQLEAAAKDLTYFPTDDLVANRPTRVLPAIMIGEEAKHAAETIIVEQPKLAACLAKWSREPAALRTLVGHQDAKVRTLALGALFLREDPSDLPFIASLADDQSPTFLRAHQSFNSSPKIRLQDVVDPQTVGQVAQSMVAAYLHASPMKDEGFAGYWQVHQGRQKCASWFLVKLQRATRRTSPPQPEYQADVARVFAEVQKLPPVERAWTLVFLRSVSASELILARVDPICLVRLKEIGPDAILQFLRRERVSDDPDLWFDNIDRENGFPWSLMVHFVLSHAPELLRPQDASVLLDQEEILRRTPKAGIGVSPAWAAAAAELTAGDPAAARRIIDAAVERFPLSASLGDRDQAVLMGSLWRLRGVKEKERLVDWFYEAQGKSKCTSREPRGTRDFLRSVQDTGRPDTRELIAALVADRRLDETTRPVVIQLLDITSEGLSRPPVSIDEIYGPEGRTEEALARWRGILRRHYH